MTKSKTSLLITLIGFSIFQTNLSFGQNQLEKKISQYVKKVQGNIGVYALVLETGQTSSFNGDKGFPMQSVYKFPIAMAVLNKVDKNILTLQQKIHVTKTDYISKNGHSPIRDKFPNGTDIAITDLLKYSVAESDGSASDVLLRISGGTKNTNQYIHQLGVKDIAIATTEQVQLANDNIQYQNWATPKAMVKLLDIFYTSKKLSKESRVLLLKYMTESSPGQKRLKGMLPPGTLVAHKTGTAGTINGLTRATNDVGIITLPNGKHLAIAVFISDSYANEIQRESTIANISKASFDFFSNIK